MDYNEDGYYEQLITAAREFLISYFKFKGEAQPHDFDRDIMGKYIDFDLNWNRTIFCTALGRMVDDGAVKAWIDKDECWHYKLQE